MFSKSICFCVFCYNVQSNIIIDYANGSGREYIAVTTVTAAPKQTNTPNTEKQGVTYILNTNTNNLKSILKMAFWLGV